MQQYVCRRKLESIASRTKHTNKFGELTARPLVVLVVVFFQVESYSVISFHTIAKKKWQNLENLSSDKSGQVGAMTRYAW